VVDRLERQQSSLRSSVDDVRSTNRRLSQELHDEQDAANRLADEGSQRLLNGALTHTPVLLIGVRGAEASGLAELVTLLGRANADYVGTLWLTSHFALDKDSEVRDLAQALGSTDTSASSLRTSALNRIALALRPTSLGGVTDGADKTIPNLRQAGFIDYSPAPGGKSDALPQLARGTRLVAVSGPKAQVPDRQLMLPLVRALVVARVDRDVVGLLAVSGQPPKDKKDDTFIGPIRQDETLRGRLSTVDDIDDFSGRLATVLALVDLGFGRVGDFGRGVGAQHLLPAPAS